MKHIACINDLSGRGRGSLKANMALMTALGHEPCPIPTALLSAHTGYSHFTFLDFTSEWDEYFDTLYKLDTKFDCIYSGFLSSEKQIDGILNFIDKFNAPLTVIDPVMGDNFAIYKSYTPDLCEKMKKLVTKADIITPNITEACILTDSEFVTDGDFDKILNIAEKLCFMGAKTVIITGIVCINSIYNLVFTRDNHEFIRADFTDTSYGGTGDIFASIVISLYLSDFSINKAVKIAGDFIADSIKFSIINNINKNDGIILHKYLPKLLKEAHNDN